MSVNPIPPIVACVGTAFLIGLFTKGAVEVNVVTVPECGSLLDVVTGCNNAASQFLAYAVLGTIPGAGAIVNGFLGIIGLGMRTTAIWCFLSWLRGVKA